MGFTNNFIRNIHDIGAILPSSKYLAQSIANLTDIHTSNKGSILEIGAGTGSISQSLIDIQDNRKLFLYEINEEFIKVLNNKFRTKDVSISNTNFITEDINIKFETIVCCLPLSNFSQELNNKVTNKLFSMLEENGTLIYFEYLYFSKLFSRKKLSHKELFNIYEEKIYRNFPPAKVLVLKKFN